MIRKIVNPDQNADNLLKLNEGETGCCGDDASLCQYKVSYAKAGATSVLTIQENGVNKALPLVIPANSTAVAAKALILAALEAAGYENAIQPDQFEGITVVTGGTNQDITIVGNANIVSITHAGGTATATKACNAELLCSFAITGYVGGADASPAVNLRINGDDNNLGAIVPGTTTAGTIQTAVAAALTANGVAGTAAVVAIGTGGSQTYNITITGAKTSNVISLGGVLFGKSGCALSFLA